MMIRAFGLFTLAALLAVGARAKGLDRLPYNHPGLVVDLGVGLWAWPLPMDWDRDGDLDLVVSCSDVPFNGMYLFENPGGPSTMPVFKQPVKIGSGMRNISPSYGEGTISAFEENAGDSLREQRSDSRSESATMRVLAPGTEWLDFLGKGFTSSRKIHSGKVHSGGGRVRANQWKYVDYEGDGTLDLTVGVGDWDDYGWDNAFNEQGEWTRGPLHGYVYVIHNKGNNDNPDYDVPAKVTAAGKPLDVYGMPSPNFADFDGDDDLDLLCGEFIDGFTYFENVGLRSQPRYSAGRKLMLGEQGLVMDLCMIVPVAFDWDRDGDVDLVVGQEDGRVALIEHTGKVSEGMPVFAEPKFFVQQADKVKFGALVTPVGFDWDGDGDEDIVAGNTAGYIGFIENLGPVDGSSTPKWAAPVRLNAGGETLRIMAGPNGSIQGPCEAKWGYTTLSVADWDHDGLPDLVVNSIWGKVVWYRNVGGRTRPKLAAAEPVKVQWNAAPPKPAWNWWDPQDDQLATQWRTTPVVVDWDRDGLHDLVMLDHEGYLALFRRERRGDQLVLLPGQRVFHDGKGQLLRLNGRSAGGSGRRKLCVVDYDGDGRRDLLANSENVDFLRNIGVKDGKVMFENQGSLGSRRLAGHTTSPTTVDWNGDGLRDLLVGAEDGYLYYLPTAQ